MNLSQLIQEVESRFDEQQPFTRFASALRGLQYQSELRQSIKDFLKTELETIVKESFKNTRVEEVKHKGSCPEGCMECTRISDYKEALSDKNNKECEFLGN